MSNPYVVWSTQKHGWWTRTSTFSTDIEEALEFHSRIDAILFCRKHQLGSMLPVAKEDLDSI